MGEFSQEQLEQIRDWLSKQQSHADIQFVLYPIPIENHETVLAEQRKHKQRREKKSHCNCGSSLFRNRICLSQKDCTAQDTDVDYINPGDITGKKFYLPKLPERATEKAAGIDVFAPFTVVLPSMHAISLDLYIGINLPKGWFAYLTGTSGFSSRSGIWVCQGVIDEDYTGTIKINLLNISGLKYRILQNEKVGQLLVMQANTGRVVEPTIGSFQREGIPPDLLLGCNARTGKLFSGNAGSPILRKKGNEGGFGSTSKIKGYFTSYFAYREDTDRDICNAVSGVFKPVTFTDCDLHSDEEMDEETGMTLQPGLHPARIGSDGYDERLRVRRKRKAQGLRTVSMIHDLKNKMAKLDDYDKEDQVSVLGSGGFGFKLGGTKSKLHSALPDSEERITCAFFQVLVDGEYSPNATDLAIPLFSKKIESLLESKATQYNVSGYKCGEDRAGHFYVHVWETPDRLTRWPRRHKRMTEEIYARIFREIGREITQLCRASLKNQQQQSCIKALFTISKTKRFQAQVKAEPAATVKPTVKPTISFPTGTTGWQNIGGLF